MIAIREKTEPVREKSNSAAGGSGRRGRFRETRIDRKIVVALVLIVCVISTLNTVMIGGLFSHMSAEKVRTDAETSFDNLTAQVNEFYDESVRYARQISANGSIQSFLSEEDSLSVYERYRQRNSISNLILRQMSYSDRISSIALVREDGTIVWTQISFWDSDSSAVTASWYGTVTDHRHNTDETAVQATSPYQFSYPSVGGKTTLNLISICVPIYSMQHGSSRIGEVVINIDTAALAAEFDSYENIFDAVVYNPLSDMQITRGSTEGIGEIESQMKEKRTDGTSFPIVLTKTTAMGELLCGTVLRSEPGRFFGINIGAIILAVIVDGAIFLIVLIPVMLHMMKPVQELEGTIRKIGGGDLTARSDIHTGDEFEHLGNEVNRMAGQLQDYMNRELKSQEEKHALEYEVLVSQINPHFIYNTLNTVIYLARKGRTDDVETITKALIEFLQSGLSTRKNNNTTTLADELQTIRNYVTIQNYRYQGICDFNINCDPGCGNAVVPRLIVQPVVENALFHGIVPKGSEGEIDIDVHRRGEKLIISISDNGIGMPTDENGRIRKEKTDLQEYSHTGIGISNIRNRLKFLFGDEASYAMASEEGEGTIVTITLPYTERQNS